MFDLSEEVCLQCQQRRKRCNGRKPVCSGCTTARLECSFKLEKELDETKSKLRDLQSVVGLLRDGDDRDATMLLAFLRVGGDVEVAVDALKTGDLHAFRNVLTAKDILRTDGNEGSSLKRKRATTPNGSDSGHTTHPGYGISLPAPFFRNTPTYDYSTTQNDTFVKPLFDRSQWWASLPLHVKPSESPPGLTGGEADESTPESLSSIPAHAFRSLSPWVEHREQFAALYVNPALENLFGNLPFSNAIRTNGYPQTIQDQQVANVFAPAWAARTVNQTSGGQVEAILAFETFYLEQKARIVAGEDPVNIIGRHCYVGALLDERSFESAPELSKWAAQAVKAIKLKEPDLTQLASMQHFYDVMRWMLDPSPQSFEEMPEFLRPTPFQLFAHHPMFFDFLIWPAFRDLVLECTDLQTDLRWAADMALTITCNWKKETIDTLCRDGETGALALNPLAKAHIYDLSNWTVGPTVRPFVKNADIYLNIQ